jgi:gluconolactonase
MENAGRANGLFMDSAGNLYACADERNELWKIDPSGAVTVLVKEFEGKRLNGPNDLWIDPKGGIYFTDPYYQRDYWAHKSMPQDGQHVYYLTPDRSRLIRVATGFQQPNGIAGTPDGRRLYIADIRAQRTWVYDIQPDGSLAGKRLFTEMGSDGMTIDEEENVYLTGKGVTVFNVRGQQIDFIETPGKRPANVAFGGPDRKTLFITARDSLFSVRMRVRGAY